MKSEVASLPLISFRRRILTRTCLLFDLGVVAFSFAVASVPVSRPTSVMSFANFLSMRIKVQNVLLFVSLLFLWNVIFSLFSLYESKRLSDRKSEVRDILKATSVGTFLILLVAIPFRIGIVTLVFVVVFWLTSSTITILYRLVLRSFLTWIRARGRNSRQVVIVGTNRRALRFARSIESRPELGYRLVGFVDDEWAGSEEFRGSGYPVVADYLHFPSFLRERVVDEVALALPMNSLYLQASRIAARCKEQGIIVRFLSNIFDLRQEQSDGDSFDQDMVVTPYPYQFEGWPIVIKRALDIVISLASLILLSPFFLIVAALAKCDSPGPIFFSQERVGLNKRRFRMNKFRTMFDGAEKMQAELEDRNELSGPVFKIRDDPRITPLGRFLRKTSIDELPQLFNVLKGDMSLVGPRPMTVRDYEKFDEDWQRRRFSVRPGITCLWQINGRNSIPFSHWMVLDMRYIDHWSLWLDLKILAKTIPAVLKGTGAA
jgi:exopolysaccharide biosynthesis polyprenyl glycosylphosphotransferase